MSSLRILLIVLVSFACATRGAFGKNFDDVLRELNRCSEPGCKVQRVKGDVYCSLHRFRHEQKMDKMLNGCKRVINGKECGSKCVEGSLYCYNCKQIVDKERLERAKAEVADEMQKEQLIREGLVKAAEIERQNQVQMIAEGVGAALGKRKCAWSGCTQFLESDKEFCAKHQELARVRAKEARDVVEYKKRAEESIKRCEARYQDGGQCTSKTEPFSDFCLLHKDYDPANPPWRKILISPQTPEECMACTRQRIDGIVMAIEKYKAERSKGVPPSSLQALRATMSAGTAIALSDAWRHKFYYDTDGEKYAIASAGPDGKLETEDDILVVK